MINTRFVSSIQFGQASCLFLLKQSKETGQATQPASTSMFTPMCQLKVKLRQLMNYTYPFFKGQKQFAVQSYSHPPALKTHKPQALLMAKSPQKCATVSLAFGLAFSNPPWDPNCCQAFYYLNLPILSNVLIFDSCKKQTMLSSLSFVHEQHLP